MRRSVMAAWVAFNRDLEGVVPWPYLDSKGLITTGMGNRLMTVQDAIVLPWVMPTGRLAREDEIRAAYNKVCEQKPDKWRIGGGQAFWRDLTAIRLPQTGIDALVRRRLLMNDAILASRFSHWYAFPADAVLGCHSMAWAMGAAFHFPKFCEAAERCDFVTMADECEMNPKQPHETDRQYRDRVGTLVDRNAADRQCFLNAATVIANGLDRERLLWGSVEDATPTSPEIPAAKDVSDESA